MFSNRGPNDPQDDYERYLADQAGGLRHVRGQSITVSVTETTIGRQPNVSTPRICDRCGTLFVIRNSGQPDSVPTVHLAMPYNPINGMSEALDFGLCGNCYDLARQFFGVEQNADLIDGWKTREHNPSTQRRLPTLTYDEPKVHRLRGAATNKTDEKEETE